jgi:cell fate regulator YaaT (PSP1 superfamily)
MENKVVGIRFKQAGKKYYFDPKDMELPFGSEVVVETVRGLEIGEVIEEAKRIDDADLHGTLKPVLRIATEKDLNKRYKNQQDIPNVLSVCKQFISKHKLQMKLLDAEYMLDRSKLVVYFTAEGRVDFRELVKDLANEFHVRIELRQVGARDGAKFIGGIGPCGYLLCCNTFLGEFETVSIRMAKNQSLSLNPTNISGLCGKLLCCIRYENETYIEHRKELPKMMSKVETTEGMGTVISVNVLEKRVKVRLPENVVSEFDVDELVSIKEYDQLEHVNKSDT